MTQNIYKISILKLDHRPTRDKRITTHCALISRAFRANKLYYSGVEDNNLENNIKKIVNHWGGDFTIEFTKKPLELVRNFLKEDKGIVIHLTMYGDKLINKINEINKLKLNKNILIIIGGPKVPREYYELATYNISITNQPHSEIGALAIILYMFDPHILEEEDFNNQKIKIIPNNKGKDVVNYE
ncbi:MAG: tRNA (cytidine(56)-2'-O)-methyltransferase [archaeon]